MEINSRKMQLPEVFADRMKEMLDDEYAPFAEALHEESPVSIRLNPGKESGLFVSNDEVLWCKSGHYLDERPLFTADPLFHAGCYYVQEASSMFLEQAIRQWVKEPVVALDLCAAPGGKSTHLASLLPKGSFLLANEVIRSRSHILSENLCKWGNPSVAVSQSDPAAIGKLKGRFDLLVVDAPCSGEGMFRKDPASIGEWSPANVRLCAERQRRILSDAWPALKPGGLLVYSTCTYNKEENEDNINWICEQLGAESVALHVPDSWNIAGSKGADQSVYRFFPHRTKGEGFFLAVLQKGEEGGSERSSRPGKGKKKPGTAPTAIPETVKSWLKEPASFHFFAQGSDLFAVPLAQKTLIEELSTEVNLLVPGLRIANIKGKDIIPSHALALSTAYRQTAFPICEVNRSEAIAYLSKEVLTSLAPDAQRGYLALSYNDHLLGFVKNIGNRANNLYPQEWRIRMKLH